ncbi:MAG: metallophosphoesterase, partial [Actinomycetota bacterium]
WQRLRGRRHIDVLLTHAPPLGVGDGADPVHQGFAALPGLVAALQPVVMLHGHVLPHDVASPVRPLGGTQVRNVTGRHLLDIVPGGSQPELSSGGCHA